MQKSFITTPMSKNAHKCIIHVRKSLGFLFRRIFNLAYKAQNEHTNSQGGYSTQQDNRGKLPSDTRTSIADPFLDAESVISETTPASEETSRFFQLPIHVRQLIYDEVLPSDILSLRLVCRQCRDDVNFCRGVVFHLHDGRLDYEHPLEVLGIEKLIVDDFTQDVIDTNFIVPYPHLLRTLEIRGPISDDNLKYILQTGTNLSALILTFQHPYHEQLQSAAFTTSVLHNLKEIFITSTSFRISESATVTNGIRGILHEIQCPNLKTFRFHIITFSLAKIQEYHAWAQVLLSHNTRSLKKVEIDLKQLTQPFLTTMESNRESLQMSSDLSNKLNLHDFRLKTNSHAELWYQVLDNQRALTTLNLEIANQSWNRLVLVLDKCADTLRNLTVTGLCLTLTDGIRTSPLDFGYLRNLSALDSIHIQHQNMELRGLAPPSILRTSLLPPTLTCIKLANIFVKPHQGLFFLLKLPQLQTLELEKWTNTSEGSLAAFITVLTFLINFDQTPVKMVTLTESRRIMENRQNEINKMRTILSDKYAEVFQEYSELYSSLNIKRVLYY